MKQVSKRIAPAGSLAILPGFVPTGPPTWQSSMKEAIRTARELRKFVGLDEPGDDRDYDFPVFVPREFAARMTPGDAGDPLLRQVLPDDLESRAVEGFFSDPVGDRHANVVPALLHKYVGRALLITTGACGVHCRYCFRRDFPYHEQSAPEGKFFAAIDYLRNDPSIDEVLLSGGDPLTLVDESLSCLISQIESIPHVQRLRIHTRMPIVIPSRVTPTLVDRLQWSRLATWVVVHINHPAEIDSATATALSKFVDAGIPVLNQSVLLRGVNDNVTALEMLSRRLIDLRVMPYYLHQLDRVAGAAHFEVDIEHGRRLIAQLECRLPGYGVPRLVCEEPGEPSKTRL